MTTPKAELHLHFTGAIQPATLLELAARNRVPLPADTVEGVRAWFTFRDFAHFEEVVFAIGSSLRTSEDFELATRALGEELARHHVRYAEVATSGSFARRGIPTEVWFDGLSRGRRGVAAELGVEIHWIVEINRGLPDGRERRYWADCAVDLAAGGRHDGVVALGLSGSEAGSPPEPFAPWFERARAAGLRTVAHAGEHAGPESVWGALRALGAERIAHGVRAIEDPELVAHLAAADVPLDVSPTSNLRLGVYPSLAHHPLRALHHAGVPVTVSTDVPGMLGITIDDEVALLTGELGLTEDDAAEIVGNGFRYGFGATT